MANRRIKLAGLLFGAPLPAAPLSPAGALRSSERVKAAAQTPVPSVSDSVLHAINALNRRLEHTLNGLREQACAEQELRAIAGALLDAVRRAPDIALGAVLLNQIPGTYGVRHCMETAIVVLLVAQGMGKSNPELLGAAAAALTMNVGMVRQSDMFHDRDGPLSSDERALVRRHPLESVELLRWAGIMDEDWLNYVLLHHEQDDGSGYPEGRMGQEIAENAKLISAADRYCAMVSARNYRRSLLPPVALARLAGEVAPHLMTAFRSALGTYPPGTLVRLVNGDLGVVVGLADADGTLEVCGLLAADGAALQPVHRLTSEAGSAVAEPLHEDQVRVRFTMQQVWGPLAAL